MAKRTASAAAAKEALQQLLRTPNAASFESFHTTVVLAASSTTPKYVGSLAPRLIVRAASMCHNLSCAVRPRGSSGKPSRRLCGQWPKHSRKHRALVGARSAASRCCMPGLSVVMCFQARNGCYWRRIRLSPSCFVCVPSCQVTRSLLRSITSSFSWSLKATSPRARHRVDEPSTSECAICTTENCV